MLPKRAGEGIILDKRHIAIILNPGSGRDRDDDPGEQAVRLLAEAGHEAKLYRFSKDQPLAKTVARALSDGAQTVVAAGGDGTICGVAGALSGTGVAMGVLPLGTFNYFARSLKLPEDLSEAIGVVVNGRALAVRTGTINGKVFLNNTSVGRYPEILANREVVYKRWGRSRIAAYWSVLKTLVTLRRPLELSIDADGEVHRYRTPLIFVLNNAFQMEQMGLEGHDALNEGKLAMYISPDSGRLGQVRQALALALGIAQEKRDFLFLSAHKFRITGRRRRHRIALDGEREKMSTPLTIESHIDTLRVIVPEDYNREIR